MVAGERGSALVWSSLLVLVLGALAVLLVWAGAFRAEGERVRGSADLVALAGAGALAQAQDACLAAKASATANEVELAECQVVGDEVEFVVTVVVRSGHRIGATQQWLTARSHAGLLAEPVP